MQMLDLNLANKPFRNNVLLWGGYIGATLLLGLFSYWNISAYTEHRALLAALRNEATSFESQRRELETRSQRASQGIRKFDLDALTTQANKANEVIEWKAFSWTGLFNDMERIQPHSVRMNTVRPIFHRPGASSGKSSFDESRRSMPVAIEGRARNFNEFAELERRLQRDGHFGRVEPERVYRTESGEIVFQLRFLYYPDGDPSETDGEDEATTSGPEETADDSPPAQEAVAPPVEPNEPAATATLAEQPGPAAPVAAAIAPAAAVEVEEPWAGEAADGKDEVKSAETRPERGRGAIDRRKARRPAQGGRAGTPEARRRTGGGGGS